MKTYENYVEDNGNAVKQVHVHVRSEGASIQPPSTEVTDVQDSDYSERDFQRDLEKVTRKRKPS